MTAGTIRTTYTIIEPNALRAGIIEWPENPGYHAIRDLVAPLITGPTERAAGRVGCIQHVSVLYQERRADMFVNENGILLPLKRNTAATAIYRAATLRRTPMAFPDSLPIIVGTAVIFDRQVWF